MDGFLRQTLVGLENDPKKLSSKKKYKTALVNNIFVKCDDIGTNEGSSGGGMFHDLESKRRNLQQIIRE